MATQKRMIKLYDMMMEVIAEYRERLKDPDKFKLLPTGLENLDDMLGGGLPNPVDKIIIGIGGAWKMGKTALAIQLTTLLCFANEGERVGLFALEELNHQTALRVFTRHIVHLTRTKFYKMEYTEDDLEMMEQLTKEFIDAHFYITDKVYTPDEIIAIAKEMELDRVVVDNLNLTEERGENESKRLDNAMRKFIHARNDLQKNFIIVYQLNEEGKALGSRSVMRGADMFIHLEQELDYLTGDAIDGLVKVTMPRGRRTGMDETKLGFNGDASRFQNLIKLGINDTNFLEFQAENWEEDKQFDDDEDGS